MTRLIDMECVVLNETEKGVRVSFSGDPNESVWLPKSQVEVYPPETPRSKTQQITLPEWLVMSKGLEKWV